MLQTLPDTQGSSPKGEPIGFLDPQISMAILHNFKPSIHQISSNTFRFTNFLVIFQANEMSLYMLELRHPLLSFGTNSMQTQTSPAHDLLFRTTLTLKGFTKFTISESWQEAGMSTLVPPTKKYSNRMMVPCLLVQRGFCKSQSLKKPASLLTFPVMCQSLLVRAVPYRVVIFAQTALQEQKLSWAI